jgi:hypothetical protein
MSDYPVLHVLMALGLGLSLGLSACTTAPKAIRTHLTTREGLVEGKSGRARIQQKSDLAALSHVKAVYLEPVILSLGNAPRYKLNEEEARLVTSEVEAQLCFELSERYEMVSVDQPHQASVKANVIWFEPTGALASGASAVASWFIPGPIGLRLPGSLGGLGVEAEMLDKDQRQIAAIVWARKAQALGMDTPSLARLGDALQFAEPFADAAASVMSPEPAPKTRTYTGANDPCARYGKRVEGAARMAAGIVTGLYAPTDRSQTQKDNKTQGAAPKP